MSEKKDMPSFVDFLKNPPASIPCVHCERLVEDKGTGKPHLCHECYRQKRLEERLDEIIRLLASLVEEK